MKKRLFAALAAFLALGAALALPRLPARHDAAWPELAPGKVAALAVRGAGGSYALRAGDGGWTLSGTGLDGEWPADPEAVAGLVEFVNRNRPLGRVADPGPEHAGQDRGAELIINGTDRLELGAAGDGGGRRYARRGGSGVLLPGEYAQVLARPAAFYLDLRLLAADPGQVEAVTLTRGGEIVEMADRPGGPVFVRPGGLAGQPVSAEALGQWLREVVALRALGPAPSGGAGSAPVPDAPVPDAPVLLVELRLRGGGARTLALYGAAQGPWMAVRSPGGAHFLLDPGQVAKVDRNAFSFADRRLAVLDPGAVDRLVLSASGQELRAERNGRRWRGQGVPGELTGIDMLLWRLTDLQYESGPLAAAPPGAPGAREGLRMDLGLRGGARWEFVFHIDPGLPSGRCWVSVGGQPGLYRIPDQIYKDLKGLLPSAPKAGSNQSARTSRARSFAKGDAHGQNHC